MEALRPNEHALVSNRRLDLATAGALLLATVASFVLVGFGTTRLWIQAIDDWFLPEIVARRADNLTDVARLFNVLGMVAVMLPVRLVVAGYLAWRRRWWHLAAFVGAVLGSEALIGPLKLLFDRPRPPLALALVGTSGASFPSGHAVAASVTVVAVVLALFPTGRHRWAWGVAAASFSVVMAVSRAYLAAHWLSDAAAGAFLGTAVALSSAVIVQWIRDRRDARASSSPALR